MPISSDDDDPFTRFMARCQRKLRGIARATRGEHQLEDVAAEAWLMARDAVHPDGRAFDFDALGADDFILSRLYQQLVRYTELTVRHAVRLDHGAQADDVHPLMHLLVSDDGRGPMDELERRQTALDEEGTLGRDGSLAVAYVRLLRLFDNHMRHVADHLLISESWAYRRCARARVLAECQQSMSTPMMSATFIPGPWRQFQLWRQPTQLTFDFEQERSLVESISVDA